MSGPRRNSGGIERKDMPNLYAYPTRTNVSYHPEKNIVNGMDVTKLKTPVGNKLVSSFLGKSATTATEPSAPKPMLSQRMRTDSVNSEGEPASPSPTMGSPLSSSLKKAGFFDSAFQPRRLSTEQIMKHEFDFKWESIEIRPKFDRNFGEL